MRGEVGGKADPGIRRAHVRVLILFRDVYSVYIPLKVASSMENTLLVRSDMIVVRRHSH